MRWDGNGNHCPQFLLLASNLEVCLLAAAAAQVPTLLLAGWLACCFARCLLGLAACLLARLARSAASSSSPRLPPVSDLHNKSSMPRTTSNARESPSPKSSLHV